MMKNRKNRGKGWCISMCANLKIKFSLFLEAHARAKKFYRRATQRPKGI
jgi:hypothetical protein